MLGDPCRIHVPILGNRLRWLEARAAPAVAADRAQTVELSSYGQVRSRTGPGRPGRPGPPRPSPRSAFRPSRGGPGAAAARSGSAGMTGPGASVQPMAQYSAGRLKITARLTILPSRTLK